MKFSVLKRKLKSRVGKAKGTERKFPLIYFSVATLVFSLLLFCVVQLAVVSVLGPKGKELVSLNQEKEALVEENRKHEQRIAERASLTIIENRAEKDLDMKRAEEVMYLNKPAVSAEASPAADE